MMTTFKVPHFNATTALVYPHNDFGATQTGLTEGFHVLRARAFLKRDSSGLAMDCGPRSTTPLPSRSIMMRKRRRVKSNSRRRAIPSADRAMAWSCGPIQVSPKSGITSMTPIRPTTTSTPAPKAAMEWV